jgi:hypothetical protein
MKIMKYFILILSTLFVLNVKGQQSDATYLKMHKTYVLNEDGSYDYTYTHQLKYHSYLAFHRKYGETFVVYDPEYQNVDVKECVTTMRDGKEVKAPENAFNEVLPRFAEHNGSYNNLRELVITHTGLEKGAVVDLTYTIHSDTMPAGFLYGKEHLIYSSPVNELKLTFKVPLNTDLTFAGNEGQKIVNENDNQKVYSFIYKDISESIKQTRAGGEASQVLYFNQGKTLETQLMALMRNRIRPESAYENFSIATMQNTDEILRIHRKMVKEMKTTHVPLSFQKFPVPPIKAIQLNNSGTPIEKALLMRQKLWETNVKANIAIEIPIEQYNEKVSNFENITNIYVSVHGKNDPLLLPVDQIPSSNPLYTNYDKVILELNDDGELVRLAPQNMNYGDLTMFIKVGKDFSEVSYQGVANGVLAGWPGANFETHKRMTNYIKEIEDDIVIKGHSSIDINGRFESEHNQYENLLEVYLPLLNAGFNQYIHDNLPKEQTYEVNYGYPLDETYVYRINKNQGCELVRTPDDFEEENDFFEITINTEEKENETVIKQIVKIKSPVIPSEHYTKLRKALIKLGKDSGRRIIFKCNK